MNQINAMDDTLRHPYGNDAMNDGTVRAARNAVCALAERVTNGIDALIAQRVSEARVDIEDIVKRGRKALEAHHLDNPRKAARHYLLEETTAPTPENNDSKKVANGSADEVRNMERRAAATTMACSALTQARDAKGTALLKAAAR